MASAKDVLLRQLEVSGMLIEKMTADLSDEEYFKMPMPGTNHVAWLVGHIAVSEERMAAAICGTNTTTDEATQELFKAGSTCTDDAGTYPARSQIDAMFRDSRANMIEKLKAFDDAKWNEPSPEDWDKNFFPTLGSMWSMMGTHPFWHVGHITVCRAALGKKGVLGM